VGARTLGRVFGRGKSHQAAAAATEALAAESKVGGKGRPTPTRREAERRNHRPIVGGSPINPNATKAERKAARKAQREVLNAERALQRQAMFTGDEKHLPPRDRGPARRWVRDYVDARRGIGEYFLALALLALLLSMVRVPLVQVIATLVLWGFMLAVVVESVLLRRKLKRETETRFGDKAVGAGGYGMVRALQLRRTRLPRPQVGRGEFPA
jgi:hypothetical protein